MTALRVSQVTTPHPIDVEPIVETRPAEPPEEMIAPVFVRVFGGFQLLHRGEPIVLRGRGKSESLLQALAIHSVEYLSRDTLLEQLWPDSDPDLAGQSLNSLVYFLNKLLRDALHGAPAIVNAEGTYRLDREAGVTSDIWLFDELSRAGDRLAILDDDAGAVELYARAIRLYRGDLHGQDDVDVILRRENLRARYLTLLARLAQYHFMGEEYEKALEYALRLLESEPCREDAHRLVMACYVRRGERAQALRQFRLCETILCTEFDAKPEPATTALFQQIREDPASV